MNTRPDRPGRLDDFNERSSAQSRRMVDRVEVGDGNGISGRREYLRSFRRWSGRENGPGYDEPCAAEQADTGCRLMMRVGGVMRRSLPAAVGTP